MWHCNTSNFQFRLIPNFIKLDFSDLPELIGAFAYGPVAGVIICLLRNLIHMAVSQSGFVGELSNFILGAVFALVAGLIYKKMKTKKGALLGGTAGAAAMAGISVSPTISLSILFITVCSDSLRRQFSVCIRHCCRVLKTFSRHC